MKPQYRRAVVGLCAAVSIAACSKAADTPATDSTAMAAPAAGDMQSVEILSPANGDTVSLPVTIRLGVTGVEVIAANGMQEIGKGHHHLIVDGDIPANDTLPLPPAPVVIHMGNGATEKVLDSLTPGPHRVIAVFAFGTHVPMAGVKSDTVHFIVR